MNTITEIPIPRITSFSMPAVVNFQVVQSSEIITEGYLVRCEVEPTLEQNREGQYILKLHNQGEHGKFDIPYISNEIIHADDDMLAILVAYHGTETFGRKRDKRVTKGQFWRFYLKNDDGIYSRVNWKQLPDQLRRTLLTAYQEKAPVWVRVPGKLEEEYKTPKQVRTKMTSYKIVRVVEGRYYSVYKADEEYMLGKLKTQAAKKHHGGGYYSYPTQDKILEMFHSKMLFRRSVYTEPMQLALIECEVSGTIIHYSKGKWSSTYLRPLKVLQTIDYSPN